MRYTLAALLVLSLWLYVPGDGVAQEPTAAFTPAVSQVPGTQPDDVTFSSLLRKSVAFISVSVRDGSQVGQVRGTGFFVGVADKRLPPERRFIYLVTNRHVAEPEVNGRKLDVVSVSLRLNLKSPKSGIASAEGTLPLGGGLHWYFPPDPAVDIAVMPLAPAEDVLEYAAIPDALFATTDIVRSEHIAEGDPVIFAGFFYQYPGQKRMEPIVRQGILAMMPTDPMETTLHRPGHLYLADVHVFGGNSGAPMFVNLSGVRNGSLRLGNMYKLLGIVSGYFYETANFQLQVATTISGTAAANSGISMVVPVDELQALLHRAELQRLRDASPDVRSEPAKPLSEKPHPK